MKKIKPKHRLQAIDIFINDINSSQMTKEQVISGIKAILNQKVLYPESKRLADIAVNRIYKGKV